MTATSEPGHADDWADTGPIPLPPATETGAGAGNGSQPTMDAEKAREARFWIAEDGGGEPTVWTGDPDTPTPVLRRYEITADDATRDEVMRRIVDGAADTQPEGAGEVIGHMVGYWAEDGATGKRQYVPGAPVVAPSAPCRMCGVYPLASTPTAGSKVDTAPEAGPVGREHWEYGVETRKAYNNFEPTIEWGASVGMTHRYEYTAESVYALAGGNPVWRRLRTSYADVIGEPEPFPRPATATAPESGEGR